MQFIKKEKIYILVFLCAFVISFIWSGICGPVNWDEMWIYGFSHNISEGMVIYKDFNVLQTPLYFFIGSLFISIFGNYLLSLVIFNSLLIGGISVIMYKLIGWKLLAVLPVITVFFPSGYDLLCLFWLFCIIYILKEKRGNNFWVGIIIGLCFITKQNIGLCFLFPYLLYSKNKVKSIISFLLPVLILFIYLFYYDAVFEFIDYCFLGLIDFNNKNSRCISLFFVFELVLIVYLIFELFKSKFSNKDLFYTLMFQLMCYPIVIDENFFISLVPVLFYIVKKIKSSYMVFLMSVFILTFNIVLTFTINIDINKENDVFLMKNVADGIILLKQIKTELEEREFALDYDYYYFVSNCGYIFKIYYDIPINKYDYLLSGNVGYDGVNKRLVELDKMCANNKCIFFVDNNIASYKESQWKEFYNYVVSKYKKDDEFYSLSVYVN